MVECCGEERRESKHRRCLNEGGDGEGDNTLRRLKFNENNVVKNLFSLLRLDLEGGVLAESTYRVGEFLRFWV